MQLTQKKKMRLSITALALLTIALFGLPLVAVQAADGANGNISQSSQIFHVSGSVVSVSMFNLDVASDYMLNWTGDDTGISFTTSATQTTFLHTFSLTSTASTVTFFLRAQSAGTVIDQVQATVVNINDFLATSLIISAGIFVLIVVLFKRIASPS